MVGWLRTGIARNRGVIAAIGIATILGACSFRFQPDVPMVMWTEVIPSDRKDDNFRNLAGLTAKFAPDGRSLMVIDQDGFRVRDLESGQIVNLIEGGLGVEALQHSRIIDTRFLDGGQRLVGLIDGPEGGSMIRTTLQVWEIPSGRQRLHVQDISGYSEERPGFAVSDQGSTLAYLMGPPGPPTVGVWRSAETWKIRYFAGNGPIALSADGRVLAVFEAAGTFDSRIAIWDVTPRGNWARSTFSSKERPEGIALSPDGKLLAEPWNGQVILWDVATASDRHVLETEVQGQPWFSPDGSLFSMTELWEGKTIIEVWDLTINPPRSLGRRMITDRSSDGHWLIESGESDEAWWLSRKRSDTAKSNSSLAGMITWQPRLVGLPSSHQDRDLPLRSFHTSFRPDGRILTIDSSSVESDRLWKLTFSWLPGKINPFKPNRWVDDRVEVYETGSGRLVKSIQLPENSKYPRQVALLADGKTLAIYNTIDPPSNVVNTDQLKTVQLWDLTENSLHWSIRLACIVVPLGFGRWYDVWSRRRANSALVLP